MTEPTTSAPPVKDFTRQRRRLQFRIDNDLFEAAPALPGNVLTAFAVRFADVSKAPTEQQMQIFADALGMVLLPESNARFQKRFNDLKNPIELEQASDVIMWLMEAYGLRPTQPSSPSASGPPSPESGTSSTDAPQPPASIPANSQLTAS